MRTRGAVNFFWTTFLLRDLKLLSRVVPGILEGSVLCYDIEGLLFLVLLLVLFS